MFMMIVKLNAMALRIPDIKEAFEYHSSRTSVLFCKPMLIAIMKNAP